MNSNPYKNASFSKAGLQFHLTAGGYKKLPKAIWAKGLQDP